MIELFLDGKPAVLKDNVSIKLTRENVYFTKNGSYTYDVELPLQVKENRDIFGSINRIDTITEYHVFHAVLRVDNKVLLDGKAVINGFYFGPILVENGQVQKRLPSFAHLDPKEYYGRILPSSA